MWLPRQFCFLCLLSTYLLHLLLTHLVFLFLPTYQPSFISSFLPSFLSFFLPSFLSFVLPSFLPTFLPSHFSSPVFHSLCYPLISHLPYRRHVLRRKPYGSLRILRDSQERSVNRPEANLKYILIPRKNTRK